MATKTQRLAIEVVTEADKAKREMAELDKAAKALEGKPIEIPVDVKGTEEVKAKFNTTEQAAGGARNAFANLVGNTAQDLGGLAGNLGSVGVAIGQVAEYTADATDKGGGLTSALAGAASMAGPMLALAAAGIAVNKIVGDMSKKSQEAKEANEAFADSLQQGAGSLEAWGKGLDDAFGAGATDQVQDLNKFLKDTLDKTGDLEKTASAFGFMGLTLDDLGKSLSAADQDFRAWGENMLQQRGFTQQAAKDFTLLVAENEKLGDAIDATSTKQIKNIVPPGEVDNLEDLTRGMSQVLDVVEKLNTEDAAKSFTEAARAIPGMADAVDKAAAAGGSELDIALRVNDALAEQKRVREEGARAAEESGTILDQVGRQVATAADLAAEAMDKAKTAQDNWLTQTTTYEAQVDSFTVSIQKLAEQVAKQTKASEEGAGQFEGNTAAALANRDALRDVYEKSVDLVAGMKDAGFSADGARQAQDNMAQSAYDLAIKMGLPIAKAQEIHDKIKAIPPSVTSDVEVTTTNLAETEQRLDDLEKDREVTVSVYGDMTAIKNAINSLPPGFIPSSRGVTAPAAGPVAVPLGVGAMAAPAATAAPSRAVTVNVNMGGSIVADSFELQRVVSRAVRQGTRINGARRYLP